MNLGKSGKIREFLKDKSRERESFVSTKPFCSSWDTIQPFRCAFPSRKEFHFHLLPLKILEEAQFVICCDGAANEYILRGHTPDIIIGDGDSLSPEN